MGTESTEFFKDDEQDGLLSCSVEENDRCVLGDSGFIVGSYLSGADLELNKRSLKQN